MRINGLNDKNYIHDKTGLTDYNLSKRLQKIVDDFTLEFVNCPPDILANFLVKKGFIDPVLSNTDPNICAFTSTIKGMKKIEEMKEAHPTWF